MRKLFIGLALLLIATPALAQTTASQNQIGYLTTSGCPSGQTVCFMQYGATIPVSGGGGGSTNATIVGPLGSQVSTAGVSVTIASDQAAVAVKTSPGARTLITLDVKTVTTGGAAVTALTAGHRTAGGVLCNPQGATINLGINEIGTAAGTTGSGDTTFIVPGQCYNVTPASTAVSVISSDSSHPFSGYGLN